MVGIPGSLTFDEYGRPFIIIRDQDKQNRLTGNDAIKVCFSRLRQALFLTAVVFISDSNNQAHCTPDLFLSHSNNFISSFGLHDFPL